MELNSTLNQINKNTLILHPYIKSKKNYNHQLRLEEAVGLAKAIDLLIIDARLVAIDDIVPATYIGKGKVEDFKIFIKEQEIGLVIIDSHLSPIQQRNLEKALNCKIIDRTGLILEIFGARAITNEGKLQVELAALEYQKSRLVRSWTHLERQRGGVGFISGPGEKQIESDKRIISTKITRIKKELEKVKQTRKIHRKARSIVPYPIVALVGYTNSGKSTLFNYLTGASVYVENKLFATLDPTMRMVTLPSKTKIILSDTVGFISDLPTELVAAFRATLEEVIEADIILHVRDIANEESNEQKQEVNKILINLGLEDKLATHCIEIINKIDLLDDETKDNLLNKFATSKDKVAISAINGHNCNMLLQLIDDKISKDYANIEVTSCNDNGKLIAWLYENSIINDKKIKEDTTIFNIKISNKNYQKLQKMLNYK